MSDTYVPLISSGVAGPLGVLHLPRMWQKVSLEAAGKLASGYPGIGRGFDAMTCASLGLERSEERREGKSVDLGGGRIIKKKREKKQQRSEQRWSKKERDHVR